jgi:hypothetical protein
MISATVGRSSDELFPLVASPESSAEPQADSNSAHNAAKSILIGLPRVCASIIRWRKSNVDILYTIVKR